MKRVIKYAIVGLTGVVVNECLLWFFTDIAGLFFLISSVIAIESSIVSNFILNEFWTFTDRSNNHKGIFKRGLKFNTVSLLALVINISTLFILVTFFSIYYLLANIMGIILAFAVNYGLNVKWTWKKPNKQ